MKKIGNIIAIIIGAVYTILTAIFIYLLKLIDVVPDNFFIIGTVFLCALTALIDFFLFFKFKKKVLKIFKYIFVFLAIILSVIYSYGAYSLNKTLNVFGNIFKVKDEISNYYIVVLDSSVYNDISDLYRKTMAYYKETDSKVIDIIKLDLNYTVEDDIESLKNKLFDKSVDAILISDILLNRYEEDDEDFSSKTRIIETIKVTSKLEDITKKVTIRNTPFNVLISGIDTYGDINTTSRNDVNIVATVNPNTNEILLTSIPRDYYVQLHGKEGYKDKLTHASYYGINVAVQTIEDILDIDINYYIKVNFTTVVSLVDEIGGVDVYSDQSMNIRGCNIKKGMNTFDGKCALAFARERYSYVDGDRHRGRNQQAIITAIFEKLSKGTTIITDYNNIMNALDGKFTTNMDMNEVQGLIKYEINDLNKYAIKSIQLDGYGDMGKTYTYPNQDLWIMIPYEDTIIKAKDTINKVLNNESIKD